MFLFAALVGAWLVCRSFSADACAGRLVLPDPLARPAPKATPSRSEGHSCTGCTFRSGPCRHSANNAVSRKELVSPAQLAKSPRNPTRCLARCDAARTGLGSPAVCKEDGCKEEACRLGVPTDALQENVQSAAGFDGCGGVLSVRASCAGGNAQSILRMGIAGTTRTLKA